MSVPEVLVGRGPDPRVKINPFRYPGLPGQDLDPECGYIWDNHGWIDLGDHGYTVCPTGDGPVYPEPM